MPPSQEKPGYLIIAPEERMSDVEDFALYKETQGFLVKTVSLEEILMTTSGVDEPEKVRNYLIDCVDWMPESKFVLLVGSPDTMPMRIAYPNPHNHNVTVPTDFYYEDLTGNWDADEDGFFGEYGDDMSQQTEDYRAELFVGRIPWDEPEHIKAICDTNMLYEQDASSRMKCALGAGQNLGLGNTCDGPLLMNLVNNLILEPSGYDTTVLYDECEMLTPDYELTVENFLEQWEAIEPGFVVWISHGASEGTSFINVDNIPQGVAPAVAVSVSCSVANPDVVSLGRVLIRDGVCAAFLGAGRNDFYDPIPVLSSGFKAATSLIWRHRTLAEAKVDFIEHYAKKEMNIARWSFHQNLFLFMLYGDPAIKLNRH
ncbi:MAG: C25 family cysteine peptidase [Candidatus Hodarchaeota archaeon]